MKDLKIFLGSPVDVKDERILVGSIIRKLNERYEPSGMRIHLYMWEDFPVEYKGVSKQEEYNKELVSQSDIAIFLFKKEIGACTLEEYRVAKEKGLEFHSYLVPHFSESIKEGLNKEGIGFMELESENQMELTLDGICEKYYRDNCSDEKDLKEREKYNFYATYGCDLTIADEHMFSNIIRYLDDFLEKGFNKGCYLHPQNNTALLKDSDYYASFFKSRSSEQNESDFKEALKVLDKSRLKYMTVFQKSYSGSRPIHKEDSYIGKTLSKQQIFTTGANENNIKLRILLHLLKCEGFSPDGYSIKIEYNRIFICNEFITNVDDLDLHQDLKTLPDEIKRLKEKSANLNFQDRIDNDRKIKQKEARLYEGVFCELKKILSEKNGRIVVGKQVTINIQEREAQLLCDVKILEESIGDKINEWKKNLDDYYDRISSLMKRLNIGDIIDINRLLKLIFLTVNKIYCYNKDEKNFIADYYLSIVELFEDKDCFPDAMMLDMYGNTYIYLLSIDIPSINILKVMEDYAFFLSKNGKNDDVVSVYNEICDRLKKIDDSKKFYRYFIGHIYTNFVHFYMDRIRTQSEFLTDVLDEFETKVNEWKNKGWDVYEVETFLLAAKLKNVLITEHDPGLLKRAEDLFKDVAEGHVSVHEDNFWDVYCYFPHIIASYYLDRLSISDKKIKTEDEKNKIEYEKNKIIEYENKVLRYLESSYISVEKEVFKSFVYHNLGFLHTKLYWDNHKMEHYKEARKWYDKSLSIRRNFDEKNLIIETLVNINGLMQIPKSLEVVEDYKYALDVVNELYRMAKDLKRNGLYSEENYYKAVLAYCTMHYKLSLKKVDGTIPKEESLELLNKCYEWIPKNERPNYASVIEREYNIIMEHEKKIKS